MHGPTEFVEAYRAFVAGYGLSQDASHIGISSKSSEGHYHICYCIYLAIHPYSVQEIHQGVIKTSRTSDCRLHGIDPTLPDISSGSDGLLSSEATFATPNNGHLNGHLNDHLIF
jgi:hypothetical protein